VLEVEEIAAVLERLAKEPQHSVVGLRAFLRHSFTEIVDDPLWPLQLLLTTYDDPRARAAVRGFYERTAELLVPQLEQICDAWNRKARAPFDIQTFEIIVTAVVEGLALRKLIQPELVPDSRAHHHISLRPR
jgi:hypothetical protein